MFAGGFGDVQSAQSIRMQRAELPSLKMLLLSQLFNFLSQRYTCYRDRNLDPMSVQGLFIILEDTHTLISLRAYRTSKKEKSHEEEFQRLKSKYRREIEKMMSANPQNESGKLSGAMAAMEVLTEVFHLETRYLERFGLLEPEDATFLQEDTEVEMVSEEIEKAREEFEKEKKEGKVDEQGDEISNDDEEDGILNISLQIEKDLKEKQKQEKLGIQEKLDKLIAVAKKELSEEKKLEEL